MNPINPLGSYCSGMGIIEEGWNALSSGVRWKLLNLGGGKMGRMLLKAFVWGGHAGIGDNNMASGAGGGVAMWGGLCGNYRGRLQLSSVWGVACAGIRPTNIMASGGPGV
ncbi:hypothetical protein GOBAR_AA34883 [Gossypium barbadense]|uniref:Uncharacterized protein n=1 Tax=Gossypium barbadense TaxID=3634 RepID=A0A2P5W411_GOSBA|nr:hypothetical protein GOBAR_AA34883 [Gossypium barbadense]